LISACLLLVAIFQLIQSCGETAKAGEAIMRANQAQQRAEAALSRATELEARVLEARREVIDLTDSVASIAEYIPRAGAYGGLGAAAAEDLKKEVQKLQQRITKLKTR
jgi:hypothetical protein